MTWVKTSDDEYEWPAISSLTDAAARLWTNARQYANRTLSDGFVPIDQPARLVRLRAPKKTIQELVDAGLWHDERHGLCAECIVEREKAKAVPTRGAGYVIHGFFPDQTPRHKVLAEREAARRRMDRIRGGLAGAVAAEADDVRPNDGQMFARTSAECSPDVRQPRTPGTGFHRKPREVRGGRTNGERSGEQTANTGALRPIGAAAEAMKLDLQARLPSYPRDRVDAVADAGSPSPSLQESRR